MSNEVPTRPAKSLRDDPTLGVVFRLTPVPLGIGRVSDGEILFANDSMRALLGLPMEGHIDLKSPDLYVNLDERSRLLAALEKDKYVANFEAHLRKADGTPLWASVSAEYLTFAGEPAVFCAIYDVRDLHPAAGRARHAAAHLDRSLPPRLAELAGQELLRKHQDLLAEELVKEHQRGEELRRTRDDLQRANERFRNTIEWAPVPIAITSKSTGRVMYANGRFARMYGLSSGD